MEAVVLVSTVATAAFTGWAVWQRWRYTPRPLWTCTVSPEVISFTDGGSGVARMSWRIENRGDGTAHDVRLGLVAPSGVVRTPPSGGSALVAPGGSAIVSDNVGVVSGSMTWDASTLQYTDTRVYGGAPEYVDVWWRQHPNLRRVKRQRVPLPPPSSV